MTDTYFMGVALEQARLAMSQGEVPVGAVLVRDGVIISTGTNACIAHNDPTAHAEMLALRAAGQVLGNYRLEDCELFVTLEPCAMCAGAMLHARLKRVVFGAEEPKTGAAGSVLNLFSNEQINHQTQVQGRVMAHESLALLQSFFKAKRETTKEENCPIREDALRTPEHRFTDLPHSHWTAHYLTDLPGLNGLRLHYLDEGPVDAQKTTLCLHDFESWGAMFGEQLPSILASASRVLVPDLIGFGKSDKPKKEGAYTLAWHVQILIELIEHLEIKNLVVLYAPNAKKLAQSLVDRMAGQFTGLQVTEFQASARLSDAMLEAPFPDRGHRAGPRAMQTTQAKK
jgi:tRNA(adenine34) deaminase